MKKEILSRLTAACVLFTLVLLCSCLRNILSGNYGSSSWPVVLIFVLLVGIEAVDYLISLIPFRTCRQYRFCSVAVNYVLVFLAWLCLGWVPQNVWSILAFSLCYLIFYRLIQLYFDAKRQAEAADFNRQLELWRKQHQAPGPQDHPDL